MINPAIETRSGIDTIVNQITSDIAAIKATQQQGLDTLSLDISNLATWSDAVTVHPDYTQWLVTFIPNTAVTTTAGNVGAFAQLSFNFSVTPTWAVQWGSPETTPSGIWDELYFGVRQASATAAQSTWIISHNGEYTFTNITLNVRIASTVAGVVTISRIQ